MFSHTIHTHPLLTILEKAKIPKDPKQVSLLLGLKTITTSRKANKWEAKDLWNFVTLAWKSYCFVFFGIYESKKEPLLITMAEPP